MITRTAVFGGAGLSYRIPALCTLPDGTLCAFCEARQGGGDWNTMDLIMRRRTPDGRWLDAQTIAGNPHGPVHNPIGPKKTAGPLSGVNRKGSVLPLFSVSAARPRRAGLPIPSGCGIL